MLLKDNFAHADLHAGNVIISLSKKTPARLFTKQSTLNLTLDELHELNTCTGSIQWINMLAHYKKLGYEPTLTLVDVGLVSELNLSSITSLTDVANAALRFDGYKIAELLMKGSRYPDLVIHAEQGKLEMAKLVEGVVLDDQGRLPISKIYSTNVVKHFTAFLRDHRVHLEGDFIAICVACLLIEGIGRSLDSELDLMESVSEYVQG